MAAADLVRLARPRHWIKNVFILMPLPHALASGGELRPGELVSGLLSFCLASSAVYVFNDLRDREADREHPTKSQRPLASGRVSPGTAVGFWLALLVGAFALLLPASSLEASGLEAPGIVGTYVALNLLYSMGARAVPLLDVFLLSSGYVLRVLFGCALVGVVASNWLLLCTSTLALFMALAKRRGDVVAGLDGSHRPSLGGYDRAFLDQAIGVTSAMAVMSYALYCMEAEVLAPGREFASLPFVVFGVLEYLRMVHVHGEGGSPVDLVLRSRVLLLCGVGWVVTTFWSLGTNPF